MKERKRKEQLDRECALTEEIAAKKLKLNEAGEEVSSICFTKEVGGFKYSNGGVCLFGW